jgi:hypothetical protein
MEKMKQQENTQKQNETSPTKKIKKTQEEILQEIQIKSIEKDCLDRVYKLLAGLQEEASSDEDSTQKKYKKEIESRANEKKMKISFSNYVSKTAQVSDKKIKKYKEDEENKAYHNSQIKKEEDPLEKKGKIGVKAVRKILRTLCDEYPKDEMEMMVWEVDENLDGYVSDKEFEKMYKRCITDEKEQQPKKLFYLLQFLMYDKEKKGYITEEDTLEILYIRHGDKFNDAIDAIFE